MAVEVFDGNTADPVTVDAQIAKHKRRLGFSKAVLVGDVNDAERSPIFGALRCPIRGTRDSHPGGYPVAALPSECLVSEMGRSP